MGRFLPLIRHSLLKGPVSYFLAQNTTMNFRFMRSADPLCKFHNVRFLGLQFLLIIALTNSNSSVPKTDRKTRSGFGRIAEICKPGILFGMSGYIPTVPSTKHFVTTFFQSSLSIFVHYIMVCQFWPNYTD